MRAHTPPRPKPLQLEGSVGCGWRARSPGGWEQQPHGVHGGHAAPQRPQSWPSRRAQPAVRVCDEPRTVLERDSGRPSCISLHKSCPPDRWTLAGSVGLTGHEASRFGLWGLLGAVGLWPLAEQPSEELRRGWAVCAAELFSRGQLYGAAVYKSRHPGARTHPSHPTALPLRCMSGELS